SGRGLPDPIPHRPSSLDAMDRESIRKLWEQEELRVRGRSKEEREFYVENGVWPEQRGRLRYFGGARVRAHFFDLARAGRDRGHRSTLPGIGQSRTDRI